MRIMKKVIIVFLLILALVCIFTTKVKAEHILNTEDYHTTVTYPDGKEIFNKGAVIVRILRNIAAVVAVASITIIGFRYMIGSVEQKAEYKQTMVPVIIGIILIVGLAALLTAIQSIFY